MLAVYLQLRAERIASGVTALPEDVVLPLTPGNMGLVTLACRPSRWRGPWTPCASDDRTHAYLALGLTLLLGVAFINSTVYLYQQLAHAAHGSPAPPGCSTPSPAPTS